MPYDLINIQIHKKKKMKELLLFVESSWKIKDIKDE